MKRKIEVNVILKCVGGRNMIEGIRPKRRNRPPHIAHWQFTVPGVLEYEVPEKK
jgi:hypothetical protein